MPQWILSARGLTGRCWLARRTGILPESHRSRVFTSRNPLSVGAILIDGRVAGAWSARDGGITIETYTELSPRDRRAVEGERVALEAFYGRAD